MQTERGPQRLKRRVCVMDPEAFSVYKWNPRPPPPPPPPLPPPPPQMYPPCYSLPSRELEDFFLPYGIRNFTIAKLAELSFTVSTLLNMNDHELDEMMVSVSQIFRWDLLVGEKYGIRAAIRAERRRLDQNNLNAHSQEELSEQPEHQEAAASGGGGVSDAVKRKDKKKQKMIPRLLKGSTLGSSSNDKSDNENLGGGGGGGNGSGRKREHPFIVTEPHELARGKKNGIDYLFHMYEECREFLLRVQDIAKARGLKCPAKVSNQVFKFAIEAGATHINKPKIRHYVHCYALHCLDEKESNALRKAFKESGQNVGAWRQACYEPLVKLAGLSDWDIDAIFNEHPRLCIWYVPTKLRKLCHGRRSSVA